MGDRQISQQLANFNLESGYNEIFNLATSKGRFLSGDGSLAILRDATGSKGILRVVTRNGKGALGKCPVRVSLLAPTRNFVAFNTTSGTIYGAVIQDPATNSASFDAMGDGNNGILNVEITLSGAGNLVVLVYAGNEFINAAVGVT